MSRPCRSPPKAAAGAVDKKYDGEEHRWSQIPLRSLSLCSPRGSLFGAPGAFPNFLLLNS